MKNWVSPEAYEGPLYYTQLELFKMFGYSSEYALELFDSFEAGDDEDFY